MIKFLKKIFLLGIISLGIINFSSAGSYTYTGSYSFSLSASTSAGMGYYHFYLPLPLINTLTTSVKNQVSSASCIFSNVSNPNNIDLATVTLRLRDATNVFGSAGQTFSPGAVISGNMTSNNSYLLNSFQITFGYNRPVPSGTVSFDFSCTFVGDNIIDQSAGGGSCESDLSSCQSNLNTCQGDLSSSELSLSSCQSSLSSCQSLMSGYDSTLNNCSNNLNSCNSSLSQCLQANCPVESGNVQWSSLFINDIQHVGAGIIDITIPEEISWDYSNSGDTFELDVEGYNVDQDYMQNILDIQNYHPDKDQFAFSFAGFLTLLMPYIIITLFVLFIWRLIRRIFK